MNRHDQPPRHEHASRLPSPGRILAIDWGEKRIGIAVSDPTQILAQPVDVLTRRAGRRFPLKHLKTLIDTYEAIGILLGLPLEAEGHEGESAAKVRELGSRVAEKTGLPVEYADERMTTARVLASMRDERQMQPRAPTVDHLAATVLLQNFLDGRRGTTNSA